MHDQLDLNSVTLPKRAASREFFTGYFLFLKFIFEPKELVSDR